MVSFGFLQQIPALGHNDGNVLGMPVGFPVGLTEGRTDGTEVGDSDGEKVGSTDGTVDGEAVKCNTYICQLMSIITIFQTTILISLQYT